MNKDTDSTALGCFTYLLSSIIFGLIVFSSASNWISGESRSIAARGSGIGGAFAIGTLGIITYAICLIATCFFTSILNWILLKIIGFKKAAQINMIIFFVILSIVILFFSILF